VGVLNASVPALAFPGAVFSSVRRLAEKTIIEPFYGNVFRFIRLGRGRKTRRVILSILCLFHLFSAGVIELLDGFTAKTCRLIFNLALLCLFGSASS
jgi:hypothetical protein